MNKPLSHTTRHTLVWVIALMLVALGSFWFGLSQRRPVEAPIIPTPPSANKPVPASPVATTTVTETAKPRIDGNIVYTNTKYGFKLELPARWKDYRVSEKMDAVNGNNLYFELKHSDGSYGSVFAITAYERADWDRLQSEEGPKPSYLAEKDDTIFGYSFAQDDANFAGFGEAEPGLRYKGPIFDAQEIIVPSFELK
jgi:hypothetical protein